MTTSHESVTGLVPEWTLSDRLRKSRETAALNQARLAEITGLSRRSVTRWENGAEVPKRYVLIAWAMATGVPLDWLETGKAPTPEGEGPDGPITVRHQGLEPRTRCLQSHAGVTDLSNRRSANDMPGLSRTSPRHPAERRAA